MTKFITTSLLVASVLAAPMIASAQPVNSYDYRGYNNDVQCQQSVNNSRVGGGVIGAGVGAVAGSNIAGRNNRTEGAVLGAVLGAVVGQQIGKSRVACDDRYEYERNRGQYENRQHGYYDNRNYGRNDGYYNRDYGYNDRGYQRNEYYGRGKDYYSNRNARYVIPNSYSANRCGWGSASYNLPNGRSVSEDVWMCQNRNGEWVITQR